MVEASLIGGSCNGHVLNKTDDWTLRNHIIGQPVTIIPFTSKLNISNYVYRTFLKNEAPFDENQVDE